MIFTFALSIVKGRKYTHHTINRLMTANTQTPRYPSVALNSVFHYPQRLFAILCVCLLTVFATGCDKLQEVMPEEVGHIGQSTTMRVLAGSELKDLEPYFDDIRRNTGVQLEMQYIGTLDGADTLTRDKSYDLAWFSHGKYIQLSQDATGARQIVTQEKIMLSPVVMGVKQSKAQELGWVNNSNLTWRDVAQAASAGKLRFMMTDATSSNSGFSALFGLLAAFSPDPANPDFANVDNRLVQAFFKGNTGRSGSSGWLAERYQLEQTEFDGIVNYESVLLSMNESGALAEPLVLIYPQEGIVTADYPLMLLKKERMEAYKKLVAYLKSEDFQRIVQDRTFRRPVNRLVPLDARFKDGLIELPFPNQLATIDQALFHYLDSGRLPSTSYFVLDTSGSMQGEGIQQLRAAIHTLTGQDQSLAGQFARFRLRERVVMRAFSRRINYSLEAVITDTSINSGEMDSIRRFVNGLEAKGGTAIYDSLRTAYQQINDDIQKKPNRYYSIVLMTDGTNSVGSNFNTFRHWYNAQSATHDTPNQPALQSKSVRVFPILFGEANASEMEQLAEMTGGRVFDARKQSLSAVFKKIRGYQ